jgi:uncharacterized protein YPO0396
MRSALCRALALSEDDDALCRRAAAGARRRARLGRRRRALLRNFGLSLLVPDDDYAQPSPSGSTRPSSGGGWSISACVAVRAPGELPGLHRDSLVRKLSIKPDSPYYDWLERELAQRFDVACCATQEQFRRELRAITRAGQIKAPGERHEKDDRHRLDDRSRYVLGWSNAAKIARPRSQGPAHSKRGSPSWAAASAGSSTSRTRSRSA